MSNSPPRDWGIADTYVFDHYYSRQGYELNKLCISLTKPENRAALKQDEDAFMKKFKLSEAQRRAIKSRDWLELIKLGGNIYFVMKIGFVLGQGLYHIGAQQRGETYEEFMSTRNESGAT